MELTPHFGWVTPTLAVGDFDAATPPHCWKYFKAILNLCETEHLDTVVDKPYLWLPFSDGDSHGFTKNLPQVLDFFKRHEGQPTLVHCAAGVSRSVSAALAYLCTQRNIATTDDIADTFKIIQKARYQAYPCQDFIEIIAQQYGVTAPVLGW